MTKDQQIAQLSVQLNQQANQPESLGLFKMVGRVFGLVGTTVNVASTALNSVDKTVANLDKQLDSGFRMLDKVVLDIELDLANDNIINDAKRRATSETAKAEADAIIASLTK